MFHLDSETFLNRVSQALNKPIQNRCAELTLIFERGNVKDLQQIFPLLVDNIFGPQGTISWSLRTVTNEMKPQDFQVLHHFFSPMGPFFRLIYCLVRDPLIKYDFSITYLPLKIRQLLDAGSSHPFYSDLIHVSPQNKQVVSLILNPFDYYIFHFAYHLINPWHQRGDMPIGASWNTVYYVLCCDYIMHFFPTDPIPVLPHVGVVVKTTAAPPTFTQQIPSPNLYQTRLLKKDIFNDPVEEYTKLLPPLDRNPRAEIWRSESVLTIFLDMWLNNDQVSQLPESFNITPTKKALQFNELPAGEYVRIVRALVKQLHAFANSSKRDDGHMAELKKITLPIMQGKMYVFLRNLIHRWPLDGSFRLVLELWLSFIQPWRYPGAIQFKGQPVMNPDIEDLNPTNVKSVDRDYVPFIVENILAYIVIFQQLLPRFLRVDLASPKNSLMLYRLAKVFDQPNLVLYIREIEEHLEQNNLSASHSYGMMGGTMPPLSPTSRWSTNRSYLSSPTLKSYSPERMVPSKYVAVVKQKIHELEGPNFCYRPLFTAAPAPEIYELLQQIRKAKAVAIRIVEARLNEIKDKTGGVFGFFKQIFVSEELSADEFSLEERRKVQGYLDFAYQYICDMFQITEFAINESVMSTDQSVEKNRPIREDDTIPSLLTPERVRQRIYKMRYEGDPELHPVRSHEVTFLVRMFYHWTTKINEIYHDQIKALYWKDNFLGKLSRQVIHPPMTICKYVRDTDGHPKRVKERLPPRISLRYFAGYKFLIYATVGLLITYALKYSAWTFLFVVSAVWFCVVLIKALFDKGEVYGCINPSEESFESNESF